MSLNPSENKLITVKVNGKTVSVPDGSTIIAAAGAAGYRVPTLCNCEGLEPFTSCYVCLVEVKGARGYVPACSAKVAQDMEISTESETVIRARKTALELIISDHFGDCEAPCKSTCPAGVPIREFLTLAAQGQFIQAAQKIREALPFPGSLGRVCPRYCESQCRRQGVEESVSICFMKRFVADEEVIAGGPFLPSPGPDTGKRVAIIGAGPAGLTAAYFLRLQGHAVRMYERHPAPGGMLRYGIPDYRLPQEVLSRECQAILDLGIDAQFGVEVGKDISLNEIQKSHDAILFAIGAQKASALAIPGETEPGVWSGIEFLERIAKGEKPKIGKRVVVVGGGNTAMDAARSAIRLGSDVTILYRRTENEMPASTFEIADAREEGVRFEFLAAPVRLERSEQGLRLYSIRMQLGEPDSKGRRRPVPVPDSEFFLEIDACIAAIGQSVDPTLAGQFEVPSTRWGSVQVDEWTCQTPTAGVFACGDCATGADTAVRAIDSGRKAAASIQQYLSDQPVHGESRKFNSTMGPFPQLPPQLFEGQANEPRAKMPAHPPSVRVKSFSEVEMGFSREDAAREAARCLKCGCVQADECRLRDYCTEYGVDARRFSGQKRPLNNDTSHKDVVLESGKCINCGICVRHLQQSGQPILGFVQRGFDSRVKPPFNRPLAELQAAQLKEAARLCPTAGLTDRQRYRDKGVEAP